MTSWVILDETNGATTSDGAALTPEVLANIAAAVQLQLNAHYAPNCSGGNHAVRAGTAKDIAPGESAFAILPDLPQVPGAIAYHDVDGTGVPVAFDAITLSDSLTGPGNSLSVAVSHECLEAGGDPACNRWRDNLQGAEFVEEECDAVESETYPITLDNGAMVYVSNFVLPAFFTPNAPGPYDYMNLVSPSTNGPSLPFQTAPGGYQDTRTTGSDEHQVQATLYAHPTTGALRSTPWPGTRAARRVAKRAHPSSRQSRRGLTR